MSLTNEPAAPQGDASGFLEDLMVTNLDRVEVLRGVSLLGINSTDAPSPELEHRVWQRLASDMKPAALKEMARTIPFAELPTVFEDFIGARVTGRIVVDLNA